MSWVLTSVFVRFCEDNGLLDPVWISGPTRAPAGGPGRPSWRSSAAPRGHRPRVAARRRSGTSPRRPRPPDSSRRTRRCCAPSRPRARPSPGCSEFWRRRDDAGALRCTTSPTRSLDTRFLGDLYQDLSEHAKKTYALLQTPEFVEEFILDRTLDPALEDRPLDGFKLIDPACGSGHFLLGAFRRILARWDAEAPGLGVRERVRQGARRRLRRGPQPVRGGHRAVPAHRRGAAGDRGDARWSGRPRFPINVAGRGLAAAFRPRPGRALRGTERRLRLLHRGRGRPRQGPHARPVRRRGRRTRRTSRSRTSSSTPAYRERYDHLKGKYALTVPVHGTAVRARQARARRPARGLGRANHVELVHEARVRRDAHRGASSPNSTCAQSSTPPAPTSRGTARRP